jgi:hypothetical protein
MKLNSVKEHIKGAKISDNRKNFMLESIKFADENRQYSDNIDFAITEAQANSYMNFIDKENIRITEKYKKLSNKF